MANPARERMKDVTGSGSYPALFESKAMVYPSSCLDHPKYQAKRRPVRCHECLRIWEAVNAKGTS